MQRHYKVLHKSLHKRCYRGACDAVSRGDWETAGSEVETGTEEWELKAGLEFVAELEGEEFGAGLEAGSGLELGAESGVEDELESELEPELELVEWRMWWRQASPPKDWANSF